MTDMRAFPCRRSLVLASQIVVATQVWLAGSTVAFAYPLVDELSLSGYPMFVADTQGGKLAVSGHNLVISGVSQNLAAHLYQPDAAGKWSYVTTFARNPWRIAAPIAQSVDIDNEVIVVGYKYDNPKGLVSGSICVVERIAGSWIQSPKLIGLDTDAGDLFGHAVDVEESQIVVGAPGVAGTVDMYGNVLSAVGAAYVFSRGAKGEWMQSAKLTASDGMPTDEFGGTVAISGSTIAIGAKLDDTWENNVGSVYVFRDEGASTWNQIAKINTSDSSYNAFFGKSIAVSDSRMIVGAPGDSSRNTNGAAYIFEEDEFGIWNQVAKLVPDSTLNGFGSSVSLAGSMAIVGANREGSNFGAASDAVYIYQRSTAGEWNHIAKLVSSKTAGEELFGMGIATNGSSIFVAAQKLLGDGRVSGKVYVFAIPEPEPMTLAPICAIAVSLTIWSRRRKTLLRGTA